MQSLIHIQEIPNDKGLRLHRSVLNLCQNPNTVTASAIQLKDSPPNSLTSRMQSSNNIAFMLKPANKIEQNR